MNGEDVSDYPKIENPKEDVQMAIPIYEILKKGTENLPKMFFTCGDKDEWVLPDVRLALEYYKFMGLDYFYEEVPGYKHEWDFWDMQLRKALKEWLPLRHAPIYEGEEEA